LARYSEEQWKSLKLKLTAAIILTIIAGVAIVLGPGLRPLVYEYALENKQADWAPKWMYWTARIEEATFRREEAQEIYEKIYLLYAGNEENDVALDDAAAAGNRTDDWAYYMPWVVHQYWKQDEDRPDWVGGPDATPDEYLPKALLAHGEYLEDGKNYVKMQHIWHVLVNCFPDTPEAEAAEKGLVRHAQRSF